MLYYIFSHFCCILICVFHLSGVIIIIIIIIINNNNNNRAFKLQTDSIVNCYVLMALYCMHRRTLLYIVYLIYEGALIIIVTFIYV